MTISPADWGETSWNASATTMHLATVFDPLLDRLRLWHMDDLVITALRAVQLLSRILDPACRIEWRPSDSSMSGPRLSRGNIRWFSSIVWTARLMKAAGGRGGAR